MKYFCKKISESGRTFDGLLTSAWKLLVLISKFHNLVCNFPEINACTGRDCLLNEL